MYNCTCRTTKQDKGSHTIEKQIIKWCGHVIRMPDKTPEKNCITWSPKKGEKTKKRTSNNLAGHHPKRLGQAKIIILSESIYRIIASYFCFCPCMMSHKALVYWPHLTWLDSFKWSQLNYSQGVTLPQFVWPDWVKTAWVKSECLVQSEVCVCWRSFKRI